MCDRNRKIQSWKSKEHVICLKLKTLIADKNCKTKMIDFIVRNFIMINKPQIQILCNVELKQLNYSISCSIKKKYNQRFRLFYLFHCLVVMLDMSSLIKMILISVTLPETIKCNEAKIKLFEIISAGFSGFHHF